MWGELIKIEWAALSQEYIRPGVPRRAQDYLGNIIKVFKNDDLIDTIEIKIRFIKKYTVKERAKAVYEILDRLVTSRTPARRTESSQWCINYAAGFFDVIANGRRGCCNPDGSPIEDFFIHLPELSEMRSDSIWRHYSQRNISHGMTFIE